jgi:hypothetical protein
MEQLLERVRERKLDGVGATYGGRRRETASEFQAGE